MDCNFECVEATPKACSAVNPKEPVPEACRRREGLGGQGPRAFQQAMWRIQILPANHVQLLARGMQDFLGG